MEFSNILIGEKVRSVKFGEGVVKKVKGDIISVLFNENESEKDLRLLETLLNKEVIVFLDNKVNEFVKNELKKDEDKIKLKNSVKNINFFYFYHYGTTYNYSVENNYVFAPEYKINGVSSSSKRPMENVKVNDLFFHSLDTKLVAISFAESVAERSKFPTSYLKHFSVAEGMVIKTKLIVLENPLTQDVIREITKDCRGEKPFDKNNSGKSVICSIYEDNENAKKLLKTIVEVNPKLLQNAVIKELLDA